MKLVFLVGAVLAAGSTLMGGCASKGGTSYDISISVDERVGSSTQVRVYMKGYSDAEHDPAAFEGDNLRDLVDQGDEIAEWSYEYPEQPSSVMLSRNEDVWLDWRDSANWVVVMARVGAETYSSLSLPLARDKWEGREIAVEVGPGGLDLKTKQVVK